MRIESTVTSLSWIPTDSIPGLLKLPFDMGLTRYDEVPPDALDDLTLYADGRHEHELLGASPFPRHWVYDADGIPARKSGLMDVKAWSRKYFGEHSPWGEQNSPAVVAQVESQLERRLSTLIMSGHDSGRRRIAPGQVLVRQGDSGDELYLLLDGVLAVGVDGEVVAEVGPGAIVGERALLEGGVRTSTMRGVTACNVAVAAGRDNSRCSPQATSQPTTPSPTSVVSTASSRRQVLAATALGRVAKPS